MTAITRTCPALPHRPHIIPAPDAIPTTHPRHSRESGNLDARGVRALLRRPSRRPGAEEGGAGGDEQAAGKEE